MLDRVTDAFFGVVQANTNDDARQGAVRRGAEARRAQDAIFLNPKLFARVKARL